VDTLQVIHTAETLIAHGKRVFLEGGPVDPAHFSNIEYYVVYQQAIEVLLREGFIARSEPKLQAVFYRLIPTPREYLDEAECFQDLLSADTAHRIKAAAKFDKLARAEWSIYRKFLFQYPKTFDHLLPSVRDPEPRVVEHAVRALGCGFSRYLPDPRVVNAVLPIIRESKGRPLLSAVSSTKHIIDPRKYEPLLRLLASKPNQALLTALCRHFTTETPVEYLTQAHSLLVAVLRRKINRAARNEILATLVQSVTVDTAHLPRLER